MSGIGDSGTGGENVAARLEHSLQRIEAENARTRVFISVNSEDARRAAEAADRRRADGQRLGGFDGVLVGVKDNLQVAGLPWTAGIGAYEDRLADGDAGVVARLRQQGVVIVGTLNLHEGALGATTDNPHFGRCQNPLRPDHTPGGSSGGSGAAVAAGLVDMAIGTDTMGSVRVPAAYCGVAGIKPTDGLIGRAGLSYLSPSLDCIGPLTARVADLRPALMAMQGADADDGSLGAPAAWQDRPWAGGGGLVGRRIGIPVQVAGVDCEPAVLDGLKLARQSVEALGASVVEVPLQGWDPGVARRGGLLLSEAEGAVAMADLLSHEQTGVSDGFRAMLTYGANAISAKLTDALARIARTRATCERTMREVEFLLLPTTPQRAFRHGTPAPANQADFTALANFARRPAVSLPVWLDRDDLPAAVQLIGQPWQEMALLDVAEALAAALPQ